MDDARWQPIDCQAALRLLRPEPPGIELFEIDAVPDVLRRQILSAADLARDRAPLLVDESAPCQRVLCCLAVDWPRLVAAYYDAWARRAKYQPRRP